MNRLAKGKKQALRENDKRIKKSPALEPIHGEKTGRREGPYNWTPKKVKRLEKLAAKGLTSRDIADKLNEEFTEGVQANKKTIQTKLTTDVYRRRPKLKKSYTWTPEKVERLEELAAKGLTSRDIADKLNEEFTEGVQANKEVVMSKLAIDVYRRKPELRRRERREYREKYTWTPEKVERLEELAAKGLTYREIADRLNEEFTEGVQANKQTIQAKLTTDVYRRRPELKRRN